MSGNNVLRLPEFRLLYANDVFVWGVVVFGDDTERTCAYDTATGDVRLWERSQAPLAQITPPSPAPPPPHPPPRRDTDPLRCRAARQVASRHVRATAPRNTGDSPPTRLPSPQVARVVLPEQVPNAESSPIPA